MSPSCLALAGLLLLAGSTTATKKCNLYNFGVQGGYTCAINWLRGLDDPSPKVTFTPTATTIASGVMRKLRVDPAEISATIGQALGISNNNALFRQVETLAIIEPVVVYMVADVVAGFDLKASELEMFGLPGSLTDKSALKKLYSNYYDLSCELRLLKPLVTCLTKWVGDNCDADSDDVEVVTDMLTAMDGYFCDDKKWKSSIKEEMDEALGKVFTGLMKAMGITKDESNPMLFNADMERIQAFSQMMAQAAQSEDKCKSYQQDLQRLASMTNDAQSEVGVGVAMEKLKSLLTQQKECSVAIINKKFPELKDDMQYMIRQSDRMMARYGLSDDPNSSSSVLSSVSVLVLTALIAKLFA